MTRPKTCWNVGAAGRLGHAWTAQPWGWPGKAPASRPHHCGAGSCRATTLCEHMFELSRLLGSVA